MDKTSYYIGIMSGTSLDGVDIALCNIDTTKCQLVASLEHSIPQSLKRDIVDIIEQTSMLKDIGTLHHRLGLLFAEAVNRLLHRYQIEPHKVIAIGSHGQTLWHQPTGTTPFSLQLGDPNLITVHTKIPVVADFRSKDIALQGQGAPFAPAFHQFLFGRQKEKTAVVNIGGMANITILNEYQLLGYDTGCGNRLLDLWIQKHQDIMYDKNGAWAKEGRLLPELLDAMLQDSYFTRPYPKSTGREKFNVIWLEKYIQSYNYIPVDIQRTLLELTAKSIANEVMKFDRKRLILCGGGAKNSFLVSRIQTLLPHIQVEVSNESDMIEAMTFAWLAYKRIHREPVGLKDVTGARENAILGGLYE